MTILSGDSDLRIRIAAFEWLRVQNEQHRSETLPRDLLERGFAFNGVSVPLLGPQGIFKPRVLRLPISITTAPDGPYDDSLELSGLIRYKYRGLDPNHRDNVGLREAMRQRVPLIYFHGVARGRYSAIWPVFIVHDEPRLLTFTAEADNLDERWDESGETAAGRRAYITTLAKRRLHQQRFRENVLAAYGHQCAFCRLKQAPLLEAAHIVPDADEMGDPVIPNGISLCCLHHAAFDGLIIGIKPNYQLAVRPSILREKDGPMLVHGLQGLEGKQLTLPTRRSSWPDPNRLAKRFSMFEASEQLPSSLGTSHPAHGSV